MTHVSSSSPTPNRVIANPEYRRIIGFILYIVAVAAALAALFFAIFPEAEGQYADRVILFINSGILFLSGAFGLSVTLPNVPKL